MLNLQVDFWPHWPPHLATAFFASRSKDDAMAFSQYWEKGMEKKAPRELKNCMARVCLSFSVTSAGVQRIVSKFRHVKDKTVVFVKAILLRVQANAAAASGH